MGPVLIGTGYNLQQAYRAIGMWR